MNKIYLAGDMLSKGAQRQREYEAKQLRNLGLELHVPQEDKSINDKANAVQDGLAERIVSNDTKGIIESDVIIIDAHENGKGTLVELGQVKGMKDMAKMIIDYAEADPFDSCDGQAYRLAEQIMNKKIFPHNTDVRRENRRLQAGDRREYAPNQYVYGTVLDLTDGHGFYDFDEIIEELHEGNVESDNLIREANIDICEKIKEKFPSIFAEVNFESMNDEDLQFAANDAYSLLLERGES